MSGDLSYCSRSCKDEHGGHADLPCPLCGGEMYLSYSVAVPMLADAPDSYYAPDSAVSKTWTVDCVNGHTVAVPEGADDWNDFSRDDLVRLVAAGPVTPEHAVLVDCPNCTDRCDGSRPGCPGPGGVSGDRPTCPAPSQLGDREPECCCDVCDWCKHLEHCDGSRPDCPGPGRPTTGDDE